MTDLRRDMLAVQPGVLQDRAGGDQGEAEAALHGLRLELLEERRLHAQEQGKYRKALHDLDVLRTSSEEETGMYRSTIDSLRAQA